jgi:hypothetical protein
MHKRAVAVAVVVVDTEVAEDTEVAAEAIWAALVEATWAALAEVTWVALAEVTWRACAEATLAIEDVISLAAATATAMALVARITHHIRGHTPATTEQ